MLRADFGSRHLSFWQANIRRPLILIKHRNLNLLKLLYEHSSWVIAFKGREFTHASGPPQILFLWTRSLYCSGNGYFNGSLFWSSLKHPLIISVDSCHQHTFLWTWSSLLNGAMGRFCLFSAFLLNIWDQQTDVKLSFVMWCVHSLTSPEVYEIRIEV